MIGVTFDQTNIDGTLEMHHTRTHQTCTCLSKAGFGVPKVTEELQNAGISDEDVEHELADFEDIEREKAGTLHFISFLLCFALLLYIPTAATIIAVKEIKASKEPEPYNGAGELSPGDDGWFEQSKKEMDDDWQNSMETRNRIFIMVAPILGVLLCMCIFSCFLKKQYADLVFPEWERLCKEINQSSPWAEAGVKWVVGETAVLRNHGDDVRVHRSYVLKILPPGVAGNAGLLAGRVAYRHQAHKLHPAPRAPVEQEGLPAGWEVLHDDSTGRSYYHHMPSGKTQWDEPSTRAAKPPRFKTNTTAKSTRNEADEASEGSSNEVYEFLSKNRLKDCWHPLRDDGWDSMEALQEASLEDLMSAGLKRGKAKLLLKKINAAQLKSTSTKL